MASRKYELEFFREFAATLAAQFKDQRRGGVLLGHPLSIDDPHRFKPDTVVITSRCLVIVDFKNEQDGATITLPDENGFRSMPWESRAPDSPPRSVMAGSSKNPFNQLLEQKDMLQKVLREVGVLGIPVHTCVLFQGDIQVEGRVPGKYQAFFSIATKSTYPNVLEDSFNIDVDRDVAVLTDFGRVLNRFEVEEFKDYSVVGSVNLALATSTAEASQNWQRAVDAAAAGVAKEKKADQLLLEAKLQGQNLREAERELELAKVETQATMAKAKKLRKKFDHKRHQLELSRSELEVARQLTEQKGVDLEVAREQNKLKKAELEVAREQNELKKLEAVGLRTETTPVGVRSRSTQGRLVLASLVAVALIAGASLVLYTQSEQRGAASQAEQLAEQQAVEVQEAAQLLADREAGRVCIPAVEASSFIGKTNVCVTFTVRDVGGNEDYQLLQEENEGSFAAFVGDAIASSQEAKDAYEGRQVEIRGDIYDYKGQLQIRVRELSQITIVY